MRRAFVAPLSKMSTFPIRSVTNIRPSGANARSHGMRSPVCTGESVIAGTLGTGVGVGLGVGVAGGRAGLAVAALVPAALGGALVATAAGDAHAPTMNALSASATRTLLVGDDEKARRAAGEIDHVRDRKVRRADHGDPEALRREADVQLVAVRRHGDVGGTSRERHAPEDLALREVDRDEPVRRADVEPSLASVDRERARIGPDRDPVDDDQLLGV